MAKAGIGVFRMTGAGFGSYTPFCQSGQPSPLVILRRKPKNLIGEARGNRFFTAFRMTGENLFKVTEGLHLLLQLCHSEA